jgi:hypothetical protein
LLKWKEGSRPKQKVKRKRQHKRLTKVLLVVEGSRMGEPLSAPYQAGTMKTGALLHYATTMNDLQRLLQVKSAQERLNVRSKGWLGQIRLKGDASRERNKAHPQYPRSLTFVSKAGIYTIQDYAWDWDCNEFIYIICLEKDKSITTKVTEHDLDTIIDRGQLVPNEKQLKKLTTKSSWSLDWFVVPSELHLKKKLWPSYRKLARAHELVGHRCSFEARYTPAFRIKTSKMLHFFETTMLKYGTPMRVLWIEWMMKEGLNGENFAFQVLVCIVLSAGTGDKSLQRFVSCLFAKFKSPKDFVTEKGQREAWVFITRSASGGGRSLLYCKKKQAM